MRFNFQLRQIANEFRLQYLNSSDEADNTIIPDDWKLEKVCFYTYFKYLLYRVNFFLGYHWE